MSEIIKIIDAEKEFPTRFIERDSEGKEKTIFLEASPGQNNLDVATPVNKNLLERIQMNSVYEVETIHTVSNSTDIYNCEIKGLNDFGEYEKMLIKAFIDMPNEFDQPKLKLNGTEYALLYKPENEDFKPLDAGMLKTSKYYNLVYNGSQFVVENGSLPATPDNAGNVSLNEIRKEIANLSGATYDGVFGTDLKNIVAGNSYLYIDENGKGIIYKALNTKSNTSGFLVPNSLDFVDITNSKISNYESFFEIREVIATNGVSMPMAFNFQKVGRIVDFSIMNVGVTQGNSIYAEEFRIIDFNNPNYSKFRPKAYGMPRDDGTFWIKEFTLNRSNSFPLNLYELILASRLVLFSHEMSLFGCNAQGGISFIRIEGTYIAEN